MLPLLYETTNPIPAPDRMRYLGRLTKCEKCVVDERTNENYTLSASFAPSDALLNAIQNQRFLLAKANPFDPPQYFEIHDCGYDEIGRLSVAAKHIKHAANNNLVLTDIFDEPALKTPQQHWNYLLNYNRMAMENHFSFVSNITAQGRIETGYINSDKTGGLLEELAAVFDAEYHYDNFTIHLLQNRGTRKNYVLRWNKNIGAPNLSLTTADIYSHVVACGKVTAIDDTAHTSQEVTICTNPIAISGSTSKIRRIYLWDATDRMTVKEVHVHPGNYNAAKADLNTLLANFNVGQLQIAEKANLKVNYRPALDEMAAIGLGDTVDVELKGGRTVEAKITATSFDSLAERWVSIELGKEKLKLADYIAKRR